MYRSFCWARISFLWHSVGFHACTSEKPSICLGISSTITLLNKSELLLIYFDRSCRFLSIFHHWVRIWRWKTWGNVAPEHFICLFNAPLQSTSILLWLRSIITMSERSQYVFRWSIGMSEAKKIEPSTGLLLAFSTGVPPIWFLSSFLFSS